MRSNKKIGNVIVDYFFTMKADLNEQERVERERKRERERENQKFAKG